MSLHHLGLFLDADIIIVKEEISTLTSTLQNNPEEESNMSIDSIESSVENEESIELVFEGKFEKGVLLVYEGSHLESKLREFLFKILNAVNCSVKDVALSSSESVEEIPMAVIQHMNPNKIIAFGKVRHRLMNYKKHAYEVHYEDGVEFLFADSLTEIYENVALKKALWEKLQVLFDIKK